MKPEQIRLISFKQEGLFSKLAWLKGLFNLRVNNSRKLKILIIYKARSAEWKGVSGVAIFFLKDSDLR